ncbi:hypothetical protein [Pseudooceanicola sp. HF7]|uniref:hypothetical protein n=1 Tax=Pseudooceanicola sp. HF7 TaxID=2721560 RepID=UPI0014319B5F|nr:hypothetical protein [Pseudooceanicola sp. HF7]NIZ09435.1 hypothetical protein [Pseudooceanicola sp. HF7]
MRVQQGYQTEPSPPPFPRVARDQWMVDVIADLQEAAKERGMMRLVDELAVCTRITQEEIYRKRMEALAPRRTVQEADRYYPSSPPAGYRRN